MICDKDFKTNVASLENRLDEFLDVAYPSTRVVYHNLTGFTSKVEGGQNVLQIEVYSYSFSTNVVLAMTFVTYDDIDCLDKNFHLILGRLVHDVNSSIVKRIGDCLL